MIHQVTSILTQHVPAPDCRSFYGVGRREAVRREGGVSCHIQHNIAEPLAKANERESAIEYTILREGWRRKKKQ